MPLCTKMRNMRVKRPFYIEARIQKQQGKFGIRCYHKNETDMNSWPCILLEPRETLTAQKQAHGLQLKPSANNRALTRAGNMI